MDRRALFFILFLTASLYLTNLWFSPKKTPVAAPLNTTLATTSSMNLSSPPGDSSVKEIFYVLENEYQQLVFSNRGGALAEINLPLQSKDYPHSIVRPIRFDAILEKEYPYNDHFPQQPYRTQEGERQSEIGGYYPLLRRNLYGPGSTLVNSLNPKFYSLTLVNEEGSGQPLNYQLRSLTKNSISFEAKSSFGTIVKTYSFPINASELPYCFDFTIEIEGTPPNLMLGSGVPEVELISGSFSPSLKYFLRNANNNPNIEQISLPKTFQSIPTIAPEWVSNSNGFLGVIIQPTNSFFYGTSVRQVSGEIAPTRLSLIDAENDLYPKSKYPGYQFELPITFTGNKASFLVFAGPYEDDIFKLIDSTLAKRGSFPNFISALSFHGWFTFISGPFAKFLFVLMKFFYFISRSWGVSIILLTVALRVMLYPLNAWSLKATIKMQQIGPEVQKIQEKHKKDPKRAQMEVVALYRERGVNPFSGCLPLLIQLPFLIGMFDLLKSTFELRGASFIPGWITNLTSPDILFSWGYPLPFFGNTFHLLPFLLGAVMYFQQKMSMGKAQKGKELTDQQKQQKMMGNIMTLLFTVMFYHFPSGLNLYWLFSMLLGIGQQWWTNKQIKSNPRVEILK